VPQQAPRPNPAMMMMHRPPSFGQQQFAGYAPHMQQMQPQLPQPFGAAGGGYGAPQAGFAFGAGGGGGGYAGAMPAPAFAYAHTAQQQQQQQQRGAAPDPFFGV